MCQLLMQLSCKDEGRDMVVDKGAKIFAGPYNMLTVLPYSLNMEELTAISNKTRLRPCEVRTPSAVPQPRNLKRTRKLSA